MCICHFLFIYWRASRLVLHLDCYEQNCKKHRSMGISFTCWHHLFHCFTPKQITHSNNERKANQLQIYVHFRKYLTNTSQNSQGHSKWWMSWKFSHQEEPKFKMATETICCLRGFWSRKLTLVKFNEIWMHNRSLLIIHQ